MCSRQKKSLTERTTSNKYITYDTIKLLFKDAVYKTYWTISKLWWCALSWKPSADSCRSYITRKRAVLHGLLNNWSYTVIYAWSTTNASLTYLDPFVRESVITIITIIIIIIIIIIVIMIIIIIIIVIVLCIFIYLWPV